MSADGSVVLGGSRGPEGVEYVLWTENGIIRLGDLPEGWLDLTPVDLSGDGSVVVGRSSNPSRKAFIWDASHGIRDLQEVLIGDFGLGSELDGWTLERVWGISDDGTVMAGKGRNPLGQAEAWRAVIPEPSTAVLAAMGCLSLLVFAGHRCRLKRNT